MFHGTDVGHQFYSTGVRYLQYLEDNNLKDSQQYLTAQEAIAQGKEYYTGSKETFRENRMVDNFIRELSALDEEDIMVIYGSAHTGLDSLSFTHKVPCMANQLKKVYGPIIHSVDLSALRMEIDAIRTGQIELNGKTYTASYFGKQNLSGFKDYASREFWRPENAYDMFKDMPKSGDVLPYDNYPTLVEVNQVFLIDYTKTDNSVSRLYYRSDGKVWQGKLVTEEFKVKK